MIVLDKQRVIFLHDMVIEEIGGLSGIRDESMLDSAVNLPYQTFGGMELYPSIEEKSAKMCFSLINNHPFYDGNKRTGILAMLTFLEINNVEINTDDEQLVKLGLDIASGKMSCENLQDWIVKHKVETKTDTLN